MRALALAIFVVLAGASAGVAPAAGQAAPEWTVSIELPDPFVVGENQVRVVVTNTNASSDLFSPIVEVPLGPSLDATDPDPRVDLGGTTENRTFQVSNSSFRSGDALFVFGEEVPPSSSRTYVFTLDVEAPGTRTIEADVRPLYNEPLNVRNATSGDALGPGTLNARVEDEAGAAASGASISVDGATAAGAVRTTDVAVGTHTVTASTASTGFPSFSLSFAEFQARNVTFVEHDDLADPSVVASVGDPATVSPASVARTVSDPGNATHPRLVDVSFLLDADGAAVVALDDPALAAPVDASALSATNGTTTRPGGSATRVRVGSGGLSSVTVHYTGYRLGDVRLDGVVTAADADEMAATAAAMGDANRYGDVDGDGDVTAIDAMLAAQYAAGNRTADYGGSP